MSPDKSKQIFLAMLGFSCNNNCLMCTTKPKAENYNDRTTKEIIDDLKQGRKQGFQKVEFTGGEPTIRKDIISLIKYAKDLGYQDIGLSTNGRMLSYKNFAQKIINEGVNRINFSLYGHNSELHNAITRTPKAFEQTIQGIKNVQKFPNTVIIVNVVVSQINYQHLNQIGKFLSSLKIRFFNILDLIPDGYAKDFYETLVVRMNDLSPALNNLENILNEFDLITFFDFPLCLFSERLRRNSRTAFVTAKTRKETAKQVGYHPKRFRLIKEKGGIYTDFHKEWGEVCKKCQFFKECGGMWREYLKLYGEKEIAEFAHLHKCLKG